MRKRWQDIVLEELQELFPHLNTQEQERMKVGLEALFRMQMQDDRQLVKF